MRTISRAKARAQAKDISDEAFFEALDATIVHENLGAVYWEMAKYMGVPDKVLLAKAKSMIKRGLITGCTDGCRGDFLRVVK